MCSGVEVTATSARRWLAIYFLLVTSITGGYLLLFAESWLLPISREDATAAFEIVIPVLIGQLTVMFQWIGQLDGSSESARRSPIPPWAIKLPPAIVATLLAVSVLVLVLGNLRQDIQVGLSPDQFKAIITFAVAMLNGTTIFLVAKLFPKKA